MTPDTSAFPFVYHAVNWSSPSRLGTFSEIRWRSLTCSFCALIKRWLARNIPKESIDAGNSEQSVYMDAILSAEWEIDRRTRTNGDVIKSKTRRLHLTWSNEALGDAYVVFIPSDRYTRPLSDAPAVNLGDTLFLGR